MGRPKRRWFDRVRDDIGKKGLSEEEVYDRATWRVCHQTSTPHKRRTKKKRNKKKCYDYKRCTPIVTTNAH